MSIYRLWSILSREWEDEGNEGDEGNEVDEQDKGKLLNKSLPCLPPLPCLPCLFSMPHTQSLNCVTFFYIISVWFF